MIDSIHTRTMPVQENQKFSTTPIHQNLFTESLVPAKESDSICENFGKFVLDILAMIWNFFKSNILFCCFDEDEEKRGERIEALKDFEDEIFKICHDQLPPEEYENLLKKEFEKLDPILQKGLRSEMLKILKQHEILDEQHKIRALSISSDQLLDYFLYKAPFHGLQEVIKEVIKLFPGSTPIDVSILSPDVLVVIQAIQNLDKELQKYEDL